MPEALKPALLLVLCLLGGCTQWRYHMGEPLDHLARAELQPGTPLAEVLARLGPPLRLSSSGLGVVMAWETWRVHEDSLGFSLGALGADFLSIDLGDARIAGEFLVLAFDGEHRLSAGGYGTWDADGGGGRAIQPFVGIADVVDVDDLVQPLPQHDWGGTLLGPLPRVLNSPSRPDLGSTGIQQRGTPRAVGQEALESR
jgi:hypothetical protein